jgi:ribonucleoside-diphosphate reductase alpha chain
MTANGYPIDVKYTKEQVEEMVEKSPYYKATANDVDWLKKVQMQGRIQKWVDHSISVTINLPADATEELVGHLYEEAWRCGCKGVTVYRDGSRAGVLIAVEDKKDEKKDEKKICFNYDEAHLTRPKELDCEIVRFQNSKDKWIAFVGLKDGRPYEIFTGLADDEEGILLPKTVNEGRIIKTVDEHGAKRYDFQFVNKRGYKTTVEGLSHKFDKEFWNYAKLISGVLRYGMPIDQVIKLVSGLQLDNESINTWKVGVERALKKYIPDGTQINEQACPSCNQKSLVYQEGCLTCKNCGYSKCG